jgi:hypothetical protein
MTIDRWLQAAIADADQRGLSDLRPLLEALAKATAALRASEITRLRSAESGASFGVPGRDRSADTGQSAGEAGRGR